MSKLNLPKIDSSATDIKYLVDNLLMMRKELEYTMMNLNEENVPIIQTINTNIVNNKSRIVVNEDNIVILVGDVAANYASIVVNEDNINLRVEKDDIINQINISGEGITIQANKINLNGITTLNGLAIVSNVLQIGRDSETGILNFPSQNDPYRAFISSDNGYYDLYIHARSDIMLSSYDELFLNGQDKITLTSKKSMYDFSEITLDPESGITIDSSNDLTIKVDIDMSNNDITCDDIYCDRINIGGTWYP